MNVKSIGSNVTQVTVGKTVVLVSYETPVAALIDGCFYRTSKKWSTTTSRHVNAWAGKNAEEKPQSFFDDLIK